MMREFMDHITSSFFKATRWNRDNSYSELNATTNGKHSCKPCHYSNDSLSVVF